MAVFTRTKGDFKPVVVMDGGVNTSTGVGVSTGVNTVVSGATVNPAGPKLDFATITLTGSGTTGDQLAALFNTIQQRATIAMYEFTTDTNDTLAVAYFPTGAWDLTDGTGDLDVALTAALGEAVTITASATFTN